MSLTGKAAASKLLRGKINKIDVIYTDTYKIAVANGFEGTIDEWLASLKGDKGDTGDEGRDGVNGKDGQDGYTPVRGVDYWTTEDQKAIYDKCCPAFTESGAVAVCEPVEGYPLEVVSKIIPMQSGSGDPSPENVRPIDGWSGVKLRHGGKNLLKRPLEFNPKAVPFEECFFLKAGTYYFSVKPAVSGVWRFYFSVYYTDGRVDDTNNPSADFSLYYNQNRWGGVANYSTTCGKVTLIHDSYIAINYGNNETENLFTEVQLEVGTVGTEYEPYRGEAFTADFGEMRDGGGSYNWQTGELTIDSAMVTLTGQETWAQSGTSVYTPGVIDDAEVEPYRRIMGCCSHVPQVNDYLSDAYIIHAAGYGGIEFRGLIEKWGLAEATVDAMKAYFAEQYANGTPVQITYKLANPYTLRFDPQEILALSGVNTLYSDTGDTTVTGRADPTAVIEKLTNAIIALGGNV